MVILVTYFDTSSFAKLCENWNWPEKTLKKSYFKI